MGRLLERDAELGLLREALERAGRGHGSAVLVSGEAGIGKTSLVRAFAAAARRDARVLTGQCDDLVTPRTLGPFRDMAHSLGGPLAEASRPGVERDAIFGAVQRELQHASTVMIVEDVHWADDATLDVLRYLARRLADLPSLLVLTYNGDLVGAEHPLRRVLGVLAGQDVRRIALGRLSREAVATLSLGRGADVDAVYLTGAAPPRRGGRWARPTSTRWSWRPPIRSRSCWRR
jgi:predicted ATPase